MPETNVTETEIWKPIPKHLHYEASSFGRIRSVDRFVIRRDGRRHFSGGCVLRPNSTLAKGYLTVCLYTAHGKHIRRCIHALVLEAFVGPCSDGVEGCHEDGNPRNNCVKNLAWKTPKDNAADKIKHGTQPRGEHVAAAKLTEFSVRVIRRLLENRRVSMTCIAEMFGTSVITIFRVKTARTWRHIGGPIRGKFTMQKLDPEQREKIKLMHRSGLGYRRIARKFCVTKRAIAVVLKSP